MLITQSCIWYNSFSKNPAVAYAKNGNDPIDKMGWLWNQASIEFVFPGMSCGMT